MTLPYITLTGTDGKPHDINFLHVADFKEDSTFAVSSDKSYPDWTSPQNRVLCTKIVKANGSDITVLETPADIRKKMVELGHMPESYLAVTGTVPAGSSPPGSTWT